MKTGTFILILVTVGAAILLTEPIIKRLGVEQTPQNILLTTSVISAVGVTIVAGRVL